MSHRPRGGPGGPSAYPSASSRGRGGYNRSGPTSHPSNRPAQSWGPPPPPRRRSPSPTPKVKRSSTTPSLLRVFVSRTLQHHDEALFSSLDGPGPARSILQDEYQLYVWRDSTLKELVHALSSSFTLPTSPPNLRYSFKLVYYDTQSSRHRAKPIGSLTNRDIFHSTKSTTGTAPGDKTLHEATWVVGDYISIALQPTLGGGGPSSSLSTNYTHNAYSNRGPPPPAGMQVRGGSTRGPAERFNPGGPPTFGIRGSAAVRGSANDNRWASASNDRSPPSTFGDSNRAMTQERWKTNQEMSSSAKGGNQDAPTRRSRSRSPVARSRPSKASNEGAEWEKGTEWDTKRASTPPATSRREEDSPMRDVRQDE
ncbi:BQ2448_4023 [Microbotryum intermedium]|uniref:BQ2448_4023 protein n=1 Tax=Microbotryum intermedium TaxID=269621 RepID=A0A238FN35_9BASI|nr:BQ2448_4023 [Microbotryum intermedium]